MLLESIWSIMTPLIFLAILSNVIPFVVHFRLGNRPGIFLTLMFFLYGILTSINGIINRTLPIAQILLLPHFYWFCSVYDVLLPIIKVATSGCSLRLLAHLLDILKKTEAAQQHHTQQHYSTATILTTISTTLSTMLPSSADNITTNRRRTWKRRLSDALNLTSLWYQDNKVLIWDILVIWIFPILHMVIVMTTDASYKGEGFFKVPIRYIVYSPATGCVPNKYSGVLASTIYYLYPIILISAGVCYTVMIGIKIIKLKSIFSSASSTVAARFTTEAGQNLNRPTFYRLFIFCCLYTLLSLAHIPNTVLNYMTVMGKKDIPWSERDFFDSKNGLILTMYTKVEVIVFIAYPLLSFTWALFFGTTQEAYTIYATIGRWIQLHCLRYQPRQVNRTSDPCMNASLYQTAPSSPVLPLSLRSSTVSLVVPSKSSYAEDCVKPPPRASLIEQHLSIYSPYADPNHTATRHTFSFLPSIPDRSCLFARHSIHSTTGTVSSRTTDTSGATLVNPH